jgi:hypothetical protein
MEAVKLFALYYLKLRNLQEKTDLIIKILKV